MAQTRVYQTPVSSGAKAAYINEQNRKAQLAQQSQANAIAQAQANIAAQQSQAYKNNAINNAATGALVGAGTLLANKPAVSPTDTGNGGGGLGGSQYNPTPVDPYASIYSIYQKQLDAQRDALAQQKAARQSALQANYNNAKSKLDSSFASGEASLNQNADEALREAFINNKLQQKAMAQYLASQGIVGGAAESIIAGLYNTYGNNRNDIEKGRANNLRDLLSNYQGTLGDIENSYLTGMADTDSDYSGAIANALQSYYSNLASLQQQNIANQYKASLGKSGSSSSSNSTAELNSTIMNGLKNYKGNLTAAKSYLSFMGVPEDQQELYLQNSGFGSGVSTQPTLNSTVMDGLKNYKDDLASARNYLAYMGIPDDQQELYLQNAGFGGLMSQEKYDSVRNTVLNTLRKAISLSGGDERAVAAQMDQLAQIYGLTQDQARDFLAELGF